jgi:vacuolar-type H+-ATPase subunit H
VVGEAIKKIKDAERGAEETERSARAKSKALIAEAQDSAERLLDETRKAAWDEEKALKAEAIKSAEAEAAKLVEENRSSVESVRSAAERRVESGITKVLELITAGSGATWE